MKSVLLVLFCDSFREMAKSQLQKRVKERIWKDKTDKKR